MDEWITLIQYFICILIQIAPQRKIIKVKFTIPSVVLGDRIHDIGDQKEYRSRSRATTTLGVFDVQEMAIQVPCWRKQFNLVLLKVVEASVVTDTFMSNLILIQKMFYIRIWTKLISAIPTLLKIDAAMQFTSIWRANNIYLLCISKLQCYFCNHLYSNVRSYNLCNYVFQISACSRNVLGCWDICNNKRSRNN